MTTPTPVGPRRVRIGVPCGMTLDDAIVEAIRRAPSTLIYDGVTVQVDAGADPAEVRAAWRAGVDAASEAYRNSPTGRADAARHARRSLADRIGRLCGLDEEGS